MCKEKLLEDILLLVFINKQDLPNAMKPNDVVTELGLRGLSQKWYGQACCATTGDGLYEGLDWLSTELKGVRKKG